MEERLGVRERAAFRGAEKVIQGHPRHRAQGAEQFEALAILAAETDGPELAGAESAEVLDDVTGGAGRAAHLGDIVHRQAGLEGGLGLGGIDVEVAVEREIANDADAELRKAGGQGSEALRGHDR